MSILDTDHLGWKVYVNDATLSRAWVWKSFLRGHNPELMGDLKNNSGWIPARPAMGWSHADIEAFQVRRFNLIRIFLDWFDRTDDQIKAVKAEIKAAGRNLPVYLQEEQRRGWTKVSPPKSEFLQTAREAVSSGAAGWVFHTHAGLDLRSSTFLANLDSVEKEVLDYLDAWTKTLMKRQ